MAHAYLAREVLDGLSPEAAVGCVFPDVGITCGLSWETTHTSGRRLYAKALAETAGDVDFVEFSRGVVTHGCEPGGFDRYADRRYRGSEPGYCFQVAGPLAARAAAVCGLASELGLWKAHNFVEMAAELVIAERYPELGGCLASALRSLPLLESLGGFARRALPVSPEADRVVPSLVGLPAFLRVEEVTPRTLAATYEVQVKAKHGVQAIDLDGAEEIILDAVELTSSTLPAFLSYSLRRVRAVIRHYPAAGAA